MKDYDDATMSVLNGVRCNAQEAGYTIENINLIDLSHQHHLWYGGDVATVKKGSVTLYISALGDVKVCLFDKNGDELAFCKDKSNDGSFHEIMKKFFDDEGLMALVCSGDVDAKGRTFGDYVGNWFEWSALDEAKKEYIGPDMLDNVFDSDMLLKCLSVESLNAVFEIIEEYESENI